MTEEVRRIGKHRGESDSPKIETIKSLIEEEYQYPQIKESAMQKDQLKYMLSMGFDRDVIDLIMQDEVSTWDLDFIRIIYFITEDMDFLSRHILNMRSIIFEDVLDQALEFAIQKRHPEYREITEKFTELQHLKEMLKLRADFIDTQNSYLLKEIKARQEEKQLRSQIADLKQGASDEERRKQEEEVSRLNAVIEELKQNLRDSETKRKESEAALEDIKKQLEKAEQQIQSATVPDEKDAVVNTVENVADEPVKNTEKEGQIAAQGILEAIFGRIDSTRDEIKAEISTAKTDIQSGCRNEKQDKDPLEKNENVSGVLQQITGKLTEIEAGLGMLDRNFNQLSTAEEIRNSMLNKTSGRLSTIIGSIELIGDTDTRIWSSLQRIERSIQDVRANLPQNKNKRKSGFFSFFSESDEADALCKPEGSTEREAMEEAASCRKKVPSYSYEQMVLKLISNPNLTQEQYKMLLYCINQKLPEQDFNKIADILDKQEDAKIDTIRLETAVKFYFAQNNMIYDYAKETVNKSGNADRSETEAEEHKEQSDDKTPDPASKGQVHNSTPVSASMVFDAVDDDDNSDS